MLICYKFESDPHLDIKLPDTLLDLITNQVAIETQNHPVTLGEELI